LPKEKVSRILTKVAELFDFVKEHLGPVQILVNSAGIVGPNMPAVQVSYEEWQKTLEVNITGTFLCCQAALKQIRHFRRALQNEEVD
jgi:3-oxoacyl-[acyl-carrier protein] reductase